MTDITVNSASDTPARDDTSAVKITDTAKTSLSGNGGATPKTEAEGAGQSDTKSNGAKVGPQAAAKEVTFKFKRGEEDMNGCIIDEIFSATRQFVIYESGRQVRCVLPEDYETAKALRKRSADLGGLKSSIDDLRSRASISKNECTRAAREIAWALAEAYETDDDQDRAKSKETLIRVDARLRSLIKSHYRKKYVLANFGAFVAIEILLISLAFFARWMGFQGNLAVLPHYAIYGAFGALGAFLSVVTGLRSIDFDIDLKAWEHVFAGATRILIGVIGALVVGLALDSSFIDPTLGFSDTKTAAVPGSLGKRLAMYLIFTFIGGFSETLVPNLLRRGEQAAGPAPKTNATDAPIVHDTPAAPADRPQ
jgi:hypothetical protein